MSLDWLGRRRAGAFLRSTAGATSIEYALIASGIAVAVSAAITTLGGTVEGLYHSVAEGMAGEDSPD